MLVQSVKFYQNNVKEKQIFKAYPKINSNVQPAELNLVPISLLVEIVTTVMANITFKNIIGSPSLSYWLECTDS